MTQHTTRIGAGGRVVIPAEIREALGVRTGDKVVFVLEEDGLRVLTPAQAVARSQALFRKLVPAGRDLVDELLSDRRSETDDG